MQPGAKNPATNSRPAGAMTVCPGRPYERGEQMAELTVTFEWDENGAGLGPHWFNIDNLEACLFSDAHTLRKLLTVTKAVGVDGEQRSAYVAPGQSETD